MAATYINIYGNVYNNVYGNVYRIEITPPRLIITTFRQYTRGALTITRTRAPLVITQTENK